MGSSIPSLRGKLLVLLDRIMIKLFRTVADLSGRVINAVSQNVSDSFPPGNSVKQPEKSSLLIGGTSFEVLVSENARFIELDREGQDLRG